MKKKIIIISVMILLSILDNSLIPFLGIKGYYPSLLFIFTVFIALLSTRNEALMFGIVSGCLQDIYFNGIFGINSIANILICLLAQYMGRSIFKEKFIMPTLTCLVLSFIKGCIVFLLGLIVGMKVSYKAIFFAGIYNYIVGIFIYKFIYRSYVEKTEKNYWKY